LHRIAPDGLADLERREQPDHPGSSHQADQQGSHGRHHRTEGEVLEHPKKAKLGRQALQPLRQHQQHAPSCPVGVSMASTTCSIFMNRDPFTSTLPKPGRAARTAASSDAMLSKCCAPAPKAWAVWMLCAP